jgi:spore coat protein CotH
MEYKKMVLKKIKWFLLTFLLTIMLIISGCLSLQETIKDTDDTGVSYSDWTDETHSKDADLDYDTVFPQDSVNRLDIVISEENWQAMMDDMEENYGDFGSSVEMNYEPDENPIYVESQVYLNDIQWYNVGIRFKGHSSLKSAWSSETLKLPFKLDFDEFEDDYPELENQRFYGFNELSFSSNYEDESYLHEKLATEIFEDAGLAVSKTAFYRIYIDYGEGPIYFGLYTAVEVIDDTVIESDFENDDGNLYEAEGMATSLSDEYYDMITEHYEKKTNEDNSDWSDIEDLYDILHSDTRTTNSDLWKSDLESVLDTDTFLNWLAVNTVIQNWDTYGVASHNYYLYNDPTTNQLTWIPWDNNEALYSGKKTPLSLTFNEVGEDWPLIRYLIDENEYRTEYVSNVQDVVDMLSTDEFEQRIYELHDMIEPYVIGEFGEVEGFTFLSSEKAFTSSVDTLIEHIQSRISLASQVSLDDDWEYDETLANQQNERGPPPGGNMRGPPPN